MTTAQFIAELEGNTELLDKYLLLEDITRERLGIMPARAGAAGKQAEGALAGLLSAVLEILERRDSRLEKAVSYGVCVVALFYMTAHLVKSMV